MKAVCIILSFCLVPFLSSGQRIPNGKYIGYEQNPFCYSGDCIIIHDTLANDVKSKLYFKITLSISDSTATLEKMPIYFYGKDTLPICDSTQGGYFFYKVIFVKNKRPNAITDNLLLGSLFNCKYCRPCGHGVCRYRSVSYQYRKYGQDFLFHGEKEFNILLEKQDQTVLRTTSGNVAQQ